MLHERANLAEVARSTTLGPQPFRKVHVRTRERTRENASASQQLTGAPSAAIASSATSVGRAATRTEGRPLPDGILDDAERSFGHDFSRVRVHDDARARAAANVLDAPAFSFGSDIVLGESATSSIGQSIDPLLAHELAHVVQFDVGAQQGAPALDSRITDSLEGDASKRAQSAMRAKDAEGGKCQCPKCRAARGEAQLPESISPPACPCSTKDGATSSSSEGAPESLSAAAPNAASGATTATATSVHRAPFEPYRRPEGSTDGHTAGNDYQGPSGAVTRGDKPAELGGNRSLGGAVSYGCYCGPGGDAKTGSRCGDNAPAIDEIDEQCRQHDANYGKRHVDSGSAPGTNNMWSLQGWLDSADADEQLRTSVGKEMAANPNAYSPSAQLYGQGIKGIFGARSRTAEGYKWGSQKLSDAQTGVTDALQGANDFASSRANTASGMATDDWNRASNFASGSFDRAGTGLSDFLTSAQSWSSIGDAASGLFGGARDAANFAADTQSGALSGIGNAAWSTLGFGADTASEGLSRAGSSLASGLGFLGGSVIEGAGGIRQAKSDVADWGLDTGKAGVRLGLEKAGEALPTFPSLPSIPSLPDIPPGAFGGPLVAPELPDLSKLWPF